MNSIHAEDALRQLSERATDQEHELSLYSAHHDVESDEANAECPIFHYFYDSGGNDSIIKLINFTTSNFRRLYGESSYKQYARREGVFSGEHKPYGYKVEVSVRPNGVSYAYSKHCPGSVADLSIMNERTDVHTQRLQKREDEYCYQDDYALSEKHPDQWAVLAYKGYQGAAEFLRAVMPRKKPIRGVLSREDDDFNKKLSSDRILAENYFRRMGQLWTALYGKYVWSEPLYDTIIGLGVAFTKFHITMHKLRDDDDVWYNRYRNRLFSIGENKKCKRAEAQAKYRTKRKQRLGIGFRSALVDSDDETQEEGV